MHSLYDIVQQSFAGARGGNTLFELTPDQADQAFKAMIPAFSLSLKRAARDPQSLVALLDLMNRMPKPTDPNPLAQPLDMDAMKAAQKSLQILFGPDSARQSIADQASITAGIPGDKVLEMMPALVATILRGLQRDMPVAGGPLAELVSAFVTGFERGRPEPKPEPDFSPEAAADVMNAFFSGFQRGRDDPSPEPKAEKPQAVDDDPGGQTGSLFDGMFEAGDQIQKSNMEAMQAMFERLYGSPQD